MRLALAQVLSGPDPAANLALVERGTAEAAAAGADLVVFPEATMCCFGHDLAAVAEPLDGPWASLVRRLAADAGLVVAVGLFTPAADRRVRNTLLITGPGVEAAYDKIHLYDAFGFAESATVEPGDEPLVVEIAGVPVGFATCYDLRFPALYSRLADLGARLVCTASSWGAGPGKVDQWRVLARARALDAGVVHAACDQADPALVGRPTRGRAPTGVGHSLVAAADGEVLASLGPEVGLLSVDVDLDGVPQVRERLGVAANRRL